MLIHPSYWPIEKLLKYKLCIISSVVKEIVWFCSLTILTVYSKAHHEYTKVFKYVYSKRNSFTCASTKKPTSQCLIYIQNILYLVHFTVRPFQSNQFQTLTLYAQQSITFSIFHKHLHQQYTDHYMTTHQLFFHSKPSVENGPVTALPICFPDWQSWHILLFFCHLL